MGEWCVADLLAEAAAGEGESGTWFRLIERLLQLATEHREAYHAALTKDQDRVLSVREDVTREAAAILSRHRSAQVSTAAAAELVTLLADHAGRLQPENAEVACLAIGLATAVDEQCHPTFIARFRDRGEQRIEPGRAHYVHRFHPGEPPQLVRGQLNTDPAKMMAGDLNRTAHVRLASEEAAVHQYVFDWDAYGRLAPLASAAEVRIAVCLPTLTLDDYDIRSDGSTQLFTNYGPTADDHAEVLVAQLHEAADAGAHVIIFPEYTVPVASRDSLSEALHQRAVEGRALPTLVVAGTSVTGPLPPRPDKASAGGIPIDMELDRKRDNEACLLFPHGSAALPTIPRTLLQKSFPAVVAGYREDIATVDHQFRVLMTERFAIAVLICMDAMNLGVLRQLEDMGVNMVLVPSMTQKTSTIVQHVCAMAATSQAVVAFANAPAWWHAGSGPGHDDLRVLAAFHGPYEDPPAAIYLPEEGQRPWQRRTVWVFDVHNRKVQELGSEDIVDETLDTGMADTRG